MKFNSQWNFRQKKQRCPATSITSGTIDFCAWKSDWCSRMQLASVQRWWWLSNLLHCTITNDKLNAYKSWAADENEYPARVTTGIGPVASLIHTLKFERKNNMYTWSKHTIYGRGVSRAMKKKYWCHMKNSHSGTPSNLWAKNIDNTFGWNCQYECVFIVRI